ncbi:hypothetical protein J4477_01945 [Candidatus Pacearchaeota archaeon]|nr:hypothetical protein [Candidatus Pacearchaeota archaeon]
MAKRRLLKEQRLRGEIEEATDRVLEQVRDNHHGAYAYLNRRKYSDSLEANAKKKELEEHLTRRASHLYKIIKKQRVNEEERQEYAGYGDETSARVAAYNYTTVTHRHYEPFFQEHVRKNARKELKRIANEIEDGKLKSDITNLFMGEKRERKDTAKGCLAAIAVIGYIVGTIVGAYYLDKYLHN